ncbi:MAG TPA: cupin domain-containing protein [Bryobacteraceae bacterium]
MHDEASHELGRSRVRRRRGERSLHVEPSYDKRPYRREKPRLQPDRPAAWQKVQCPFHCHHGEEEMFFILDGEGELRFGEQRFPIRRHDVIARPPGGPEVAHQIINTGTTTIRDLSLSTLVEVEACEYPDSGKVLIVSGKRGNRTLRKMFRAENTVDYYDRENN